MSGCPTITNLQLSREGQNAIKEIQTKVKFGKLLSKTVSGGTLINIFADKKLAPVIFNVYNTDWVLLSKAVVGISEAARYEIRKISMTQVLRSQGGDEYVFWQAMYDMCLFSE